MTSVLLYSSGMDSYIIKAIYKPEVLLYVNMGTEDGKRELENVKQDRNVEIIDLPLSQWELHNKIIPYRNTMLALVGAQYGNDIIFGFTDGDTTKDKDYVFKSQTENVLNYFALDSNKVRVEEYPYTICMPLKALTKTEALEEYIKRGNSIQSLLKESRSCYSAGDKECGKCRSCIRKAIALKLNNIDYVKYNVFEKREPLLDIDTDTHEKMKSRGREGKEYERVINIIK